MIVVRRPRRLGRATRATFRRTEPASRRRRKNVAGASAARRVTNLSTFSAGFRLFQVEVFDVPQSLWVGLFVGHFFGLLVGVFDDGFGDFGLFLRIDGKPNFVGFGINFLRLHFFNLKFCIVEAIKIYF